MAARDGRRAVARGRVARTGVASGKPDGPARRARAGRGGGDRTAHLAAVGLGRQHLVVARPAGIRLRFRARARRRWPYAKARDGARDRGMPDAPDRRPPGGRPRQGRPAGRRTRPTRRVRRKRGAPGRHARGGRAARRPGGAPAAKGEVTGPFTAASPRSAGRAEALVAAASRRRATDRAGGARQAARRAADARRSRRARKPPARARRQARRRPRRSRGKPPAQPRRRPTEATEELRRLAGGNANRAIDTLARASEAFSRGHERDALRILRR